MTLDTAKFAAIVETAKTKAANSPRWIRAIERAADALQSGELIVTLLADGARVTSPRGSYFVNGHCECAASRHGHAECYHRASVRLVEMMETAPAQAPTPRPARIVRSIERDVVTGRRVRVTYCDNWPI